MQRQFRLQRSADFERVRAEGRVWRHPFLSMAVAPNTLGHNRYGFVVSRRLGGAVVRNRTRRILREIVRLATPCLKAGFDITFIARNEMAGQPYRELQAALHDLFRRASLWQQESAS
jgi:ribonuclease P protein component